ncbi:MAG: dihydroorotate dehydrogenase electron transfer subunit [Proteobacteria bacterium]|nr:dihydroorotate dehydrogenase electron transfer subunit [Pseudomonadota bacterium]MBU1594540.1 dihydroorotate dehydrogenase electron transfer subunit [Pseudomonadota bacterium]
MVERNCREVKIREIRFLGTWDEPSDFMELVLENPGWESYRPGQFAMLRAKLWGLELPWGRPFSISRVDAESVTFFIQVVGRGTSRLAQLRANDEVVVWGPLGNGFSVLPETPTLLLAGGMGLAPFRGYIERHPTPKYLRLLFAHRPALDFYPYSDMGQKVRAEAIQERSTDDLPDIIRRIETVMDECAGGLALACGPTPFLRTVQAHALKKGIRAEISLEKTMACGIGACLGCVCKNGQDRHVQVCAHGPVFPVADIRI